MSKCIYLNEIIKSLKSSCDTLFHDLSRTITTQSLESLRNNLNTVFRSQYGTSGLSRFFAHVNLNKTFAHLFPSHYIHNHTFGRLYLRILSSILIFTYQQLNYMFILTYYVFYTTYTTYILQIRRLLCKGKEPLNLRSGY